MPIPRRRKPYVVPEEIEKMDCEFPTPTPQECSVCYGTRPEYHRTTECGHGLCRLCYKRIYEKVCPICRADINPETFEYKRPLFTPSSRYGKIKERLQLFLSRRMFYQDCKGVRYRKYINLMTSNANVFYFRGGYFPVCVSNVFDEIYQQFNVQEVVALYAYLLVGATNKVPLEIRRQLIGNIKDAISLY